MTLQRWLDWKRPRPVAAWEETDLRDVDPSVVWTIMGDLARLDEWAPTEKTQWAGDLPEAGEVFPTLLKIGWRRYPVTCEVLNWEAGRRYRLKLGGLPMSENVEVECRVEAMVEPDRTGSRVAVGYGGAVSGWAAGFIHTAAARRARQSLRRVEKLVAARNRSTGS